MSPKVTDVYELFEHDILPRDLQFPPEVSSGRDYSRIGVYRQSGHP